MPRRSRSTTPQEVLADLQGFLANFSSELDHEDLRKRVLALVPVYHSVRDLGSSLIRPEDADSGMDRLLLYLRKYQGIVISGDELMVVSGIGEWARRVRQLRKEFGWKVLAGATANEMAAEGEITLESLDPVKLKVDDYILVDPVQDLEAAHRWHVGNRIRRKSTSVKDKVLEYLRANVGKPVLGEELRYVADDKREWARRARELRTDHGWPVATKSSGRPELPIGTYLLEEDRQSPSHDRNIPDPVRRQALVRDGYHCQCCSWRHELWDRSDPRHLELHHIHEHARGGGNELENLVTLCTVCHDALHASRLVWLEYRLVRCTNTV